MNISENPVATDANLPELSNNQDNQNFPETSIINLNYPTPENLPTSTKAQNDPQNAIPERIEEYEYESGKKTYQIKNQMKNFLKKKKSKLMKEDRLSRFKFKPNCCSKYYALCCLNCDKLTKNYTQTICQQLLLPLFIIVIPTFFRFCFLNSKI